MLGASVEDLTRRPAKVKLTTYWRVPEGAEARELVYDVLAAGVESGKVVGRRLLLYDTSWRISPASAQERWSAYEEVEVLARGLVVVYMTVIAPAVPGSGSLGTAYGSLVAVRPEEGAGGKVQTATGTLVVRGGRVTAAVPLLDVGAWTRILGDIGASSAEGVVDAFALWAHGRAASGGSSKGAEAPA